jgi:hypothetical protein
MHSKLTKNRSNDVEVEDVRLWSFLGEALDRLGSRDGQEADAHEHSTDRDLTISEFDTLEIQNTETVRGYQAVESKNLVHLNSGHESATTLSDNVRNRDNVAELTGEWCSD